MESKAKTITIRATSRASRRKNIRTISGRNRANSYGRGSKSIC